ncbi:hypothetical protein MMC13_005676 [Lambiella insularis]|nr:hypothetical protein [Lambiella insularis]
MYPYCQYIRVLDLRDLKELLEDLKFQTDFIDHFFAGELSRFRHETETPMETRSQSKRSRRLNTIATLEAIGEAITQQTPLLEELDGEVGCAALQRWIPRLPNLQQMTLWNGAALAGAGNLIHTHCPNFKSLRFYLWSDADADSLFAAFLLGLRPQSLKTLEIVSFSTIGAETFLALNSQGRSLRELKINNIKTEAMPFLSTLKGCTALRSLFLTEATPSTDLERTQNDVFLEVISWLQECRDLQVIIFEKFLSAPAILTPLLLESSIHLEKLEVSNYVASGAKDFHQALAHQQSLRSILLKGDGEDCDVDALVSALSKLVHLVELELTNVSDYFRDEHICMLARSLPELESLWVSGWGISDAIWPYLSELHSLRRLDLTAWSSFTEIGLLDYISSLGPGNWGLSLSVMMADPDSALTEEAQNLVHKALASKVEGRFDYTLARGKVYPMQ